MMHDITHIKDPVHRETVYQAFQEELFNPLASALGLELGLEDRRAIDFSAWAFLGLVNTFVGKSERLAASPGQFAEQLVALFVDGAPRRHDS